MNPTPTPALQYSQEKTYTYGSNAHYAYLFVDAQKKQTIEILHAFLREIKGILYNSTEPNIARIKLAWWKEEIGHLYEGSPEHPISQALLTPINTYHLQKTYFNYIIESVEMDLSHHRYIDWLSLKKFFTLQSGAFACLISQVLYPATENSIKFAQFLAIAIHFVDVLCNMGKDASQGRIYLPMDHLREHSVQASDILNNTYSQNFDHLMQAEVAFALQLFNEAFSYLTPPLKKPLRPCLIKAHLSLSLLHKHKKWPALDTDSYLSPLRKLLIAAKVWLSGGTFYGH